MRRILALLLAAITWISIQHVEAGERLPQECTVVHYPDDPRKDELICLDSAMKDDNMCRSTIYTYLFMNKEYSVVPCPEKKYNEELWSDRSLIMKRGSEYIKVLPTELLHASSGKSSPSSSASAVDARKSGGSNGDKPKTAKPVNANECIKVLEDQRSKNKNLSDSWEVRLTNTCRTNIAVHICLEKTDGYADCGLANPVEPGSEKYFSTPHGTGRKAFKACLSPDGNPGVSLCKSGFDSAEKIPFSKIRFGSR